MADGTTLRCEGTVVTSFQLGSRSRDTLKQSSLDQPEQLQLQCLLQEKLTLSKDGILHRTSSQGICRLSYLLL